MSLLLSGILYTAAVFLGGFGLGLFRGLTLRDKARTK